MSGAKNASGRKKRLDVIAKVDPGAGVSTRFLRVPRAGNTNHTRPLRIVMVIPYDPYYQPFVIRSLRFAEELMRRGHHVDFFYAPMPAKKAGNRLRDELPGGIVGQPCRGRNLGDHKQLSRAIAACDVVHFQKAKPPHSWLALTLGLAHGKPIHQDWDDDEGAFWLQTTSDRIRAARLSDVGSLVRTGRAAIAAGTSIATEWVIPKLVDSIGGATISLRQKCEHWGADKAAIFPARVGVDSHVFSPARRDEAMRSQLGLDGPTVVYAGSFDVRPDLDFFISALKRTLALQPTARCLVIGGGFGREHFIGELTRAGVRSQVVFSNGLIPFAEMPRYLASTDLAALPFRDNAINRGKSSLTLLECMASGLPVVTHDVGDIGWMLGGGGEIGVLDDPNDFGARMARLLFDPEASKKLAAAGRARAESVFSWSGTVDYLEKAYQFAIAQSAGTKR